MKIIHDEILSDSLGMWDADLAEVYFARAVVNVGSRLANGFSELPKARRLIFMARAKQLAESGRPKHAAWRALVEEVIRLQVLDTLLDKRPGIFDIHKFQSYQNKCWQSWVDHIDLAPRQLRTIKGEIRSSASMRNLHAPPQRKKW